jgi:hypothetical protein
MEQLLKLRTQWGLLQKKDTHQMADVQNR